MKGRNRDIAWYAITDQEWPAVRAGFDRWVAAEKDAQIAAETLPVWL